MAELVEALSSFNPADRKAAREQLAAKATFPAENQWVNMHLHTFFSYNGEGWSPSRIAYEMKKLGLYSAAICDFDVSSKSGMCQARMFWMMANSRAPG